MKKIKMFTSAQDGERRLVHKDGDELQEEVNQWLEENNGKVEVISLHQTIQEALILTILYEVKQ